MTGAPLENKMLAGTRAQQEETHANQIFRFRRLTDRRLTLTASLAAQQAAKTEEKKWDVNAPPGEAATVSIDTRTGTWMSVDVSPDGHTLVFDLLGDLYTLPIAGGEATRPDAFGSPGTCRRASRPTASGSPT